MARGLTGRVTAVAARAGKRVWSSSEQKCARMVARYQRTRDGGGVDAERAPIVRTGNERRKRAGGERKGVAFRLIAQFASVKFTGIACVRRRVRAV